MSKKGPSWEREFSELLSAWWSDGQRTDLFWRTSQSGGRATVRTRKSLTTVGQYGDITATDPEGLPFIKVFTPELKRGYGTSSPFDILDRGPKSTSKLYWDWIEKAQETVKAAGSKFWLFVVRRDRRVPFVIMPELAWYETSLAFANCCPYAEVRIPGHNVRITTLEEFFGKCEPNNVREIARKMTTKAS